MVVGCACALRGNHQGSKWMFRIASSAECRTSRRLELSRKHFTGVTLGRFVHVYVGKAELCFGIEGCELSAKAQSAHWDLADAPPFSVSELEDMFHSHACSGCSFAA